MRFPLEWVREFVEIPIPPSALAERVTAAGFPVDAVEGDGDEAVLDVDVPANRPDVMNVYGLAREIAAFTGKRLCPYPSGVEEAAGRPPASRSAAVTIEAQDLCGRYCGRVLRNVSAGTSPDWIARRLRAVGLNPVNNLVDVTNYVLWELGHPLHAFDLPLLHGRKIVVRRARKGESLQTLDGEMRHLDPDMLVIADADRAVAIAGVMGGAATMISSGTAEVLLESAWFQPASVRRTSKRLAISTDASYRFERGADVEAAHVAIDRAAALLAQVAGAEVAPGLLDARVEGAMAKRTIHLRMHRVAALLGAQVAPERASSALTGLGFDVARSGNGFEVVVPHHRQDVAAEVDLIEEVGRSVGYDEIPERLPLLPGSGAVHRAGHRMENRLRASLLASGYTEAISYSFISREHDWLLREEGDEPVALANPMAEGQDVLRSTMLPGLAAGVRHNLNRGVRDVRLFEVGRVFRRTAAPQGGARAAKGAVSGTEESLRAGLAAAGLARPRHWVESAREAGLYDVKGALEEALARLRLEAAFSPLAGTHPFQAGAAFRVSVKGRPVGRIGVLSAEAMARLDIKARTVLAEIDLTELLGLPEERTIFRPIPRFPASSRDMALLVRKGTPWAGIEKAIREAGGDVVARVAPFDRYEGAAVPAGSVSLAVNVVYQHPDRTLASEEIQAAESRILAALEGRFGITLRQQQPTGNRSKGADA